MLEMFQQFHFVLKELQLIQTEKFENVFDAKIKELIYLGDHIRTRVESMWK